MTNVHIAHASEIRIAHEKDGGDISAIYAPFVRDTAVSFEVDPPDGAEMGTRVAKTLPSHPWLVWDDGGRVRGYAYGSRHRDRAAYRWSADVTVYIHEDARGRGVGSALYAALLAILERQGFRRAYAGITLPNAASVALHESCGFRHIGSYEAVGWKLGAWHAVGWWGRELARADAATPAEPLPFSSLRDDALLARTLSDAGRRLA